MPSLADEEIVARVFLTKTLLSFRKNVKRCPALCCLHICTLSHTRTCRSLALTDFLVSMLVCPFFAWMTFYDQWAFFMWHHNQDPELACKIFIFVDVTCCTASILHLCAIAHDRLAARSRSNN